MMDELLTGRPINDKIPGARNLAGEGSYTKKQSGNGQGQSTDKCDREFCNVIVGFACRKICLARHERYSTCGKWIGRCDGCRFFLRLLSHLRCSKYLANHTTFSNKLSGNVYDLCLSNYPCIRAY